VWFGGAQFACAHAEWRVSTVDPSEREGRGTNYRLHAR
jgi:hypothetical protein